MPTPDAGSAADNSTELDAEKAVMQPEPEPEPELEPEPAVSEAQRAAAEAKKAEGNAAFKAKRYKQAIGLYSEAAELDPTCAVYFCNRSTCYANLGDWKGASHAPTGAPVHPCLNFTLRSIDARRPENGVARREQRKGLVAAGESASTNAAARRN